VAPHVDTGTRVSVLPPGATRAWVLVDDCERQPGLFEADASQDATHPATDDDNMALCLLRLRDLVPPGDPPVVPTFELQVVEEQACQPPLDRSSTQKAHHLLQQVTGQLHRDASAVAVGGDGRKGTSPDDRHVFLGHGALDVERHTHIRLDGTADP